MAGVAANFRYFILGLLAEQSMSGYDIQRFLKSLGWLMGNPSFGAIYPALHALLGDGLVTVETTSQASQRIRKIYSITDAGREALHEWVAQPTKSRTNVKSFVIELILVGNLAQDRLSRLLERRHEAVAAHYAALEPILEDLGERVNQGQRMAIEYGLATASAELAWLERMLAQLSEQPESEKVE
ncbi:MAG: PadR family transcriptional regulator [Anaerolineae bacterium]|nr:PadR family transcriptional regulator [Anaerolineae bacterium]